MEPLEQAVVGQRHVARAQQKGEVMGMKQPNIVFVLREGVDV